MGWIGTGWSEEDGWMSGWPIHRETHGPLDNGIGQCEAMATLSCAQSHCIYRHKHVSSSQWTFQE